MVQSGRGTIVESTRKSVEQAAIAAHRTQTPSLTIPSSSGNASASRNIKPKAITRMSIVRSTGGGLTLVNRGTAGRTAVTGAVKRLQPRRLVFVHRLIPGGLGAARPLFGARRWSTVRRAPRVVVPAFRFESSRVFPLRSRECAVRASIQATNRLSVGRGHAARGRCTGGDHRRRAQASPNHTVNTAPPPSRFSAATRAPCSSATLRTTARPRPLPRGLPVR